MTVTHMHRGWLSDQALYSSTGQLHFGKLQLLSLGVKFTPFPVKLSPDGHLGLEVKVSLQD